MRALRPLTRFYSRDNTLSSKLTNPKDIPAATALRAVRILMIMENCSYLRDPRIQREAKTLLAAGYRVSVISPGKSRQRYDIIDGVKVYWYPLWFANGGL